MSKLRTEIVSFIQTFIYLFFLTLGTAVSTLPPGAFTDIHTYSTSFFIGIIVAAGRSAFKLVWQQIMPVSVGGTPRD